MARRCAAIFAALFIFLLPLRLVADDVFLTSPDGAVSISGDLLGFDGEFYRVATVYGELTVDGTGVACEGPGCPNLEDFVAKVVFSGARSMGRLLLPALVEGYALRNGFRTERSKPDEDVLTYSLIDRTSEKLKAEFIFRLDTTEVGFADLLADEADVVMALREIAPEEHEAAKAEGLGDLNGLHRSRVLSLDALVPIVASVQGVGSLSLSDLADVISGRTTRWSEIGGPDAPIDLHIPAQDTGAGQALFQRLDVSDLSPTAMLHADAIDLVSAVKNNPFALGITMLSEAAPAEVLPLSGTCGFAVHALRRTIKAEDYPMTMPMFLYLPARRLPKVARNFLAFARSPSAQAVIRRAGLVDQSPESIPISIQGNRLANAILSAGEETSLTELQRMIALLGPMERQSVTFRFEPGSAVLDAQSRSNIGLMAQALENGDYDTRTLAFVGFSDGQGSADANRDIALKRAGAVRDAIVENAENADLSRLQILVDAFGEALPMACDDSDWGRRANRRVEVWLR